MRTLMSDAAHELVFSKLDALVDGDNQYICELDVYCEKTESVHYEHECYIEYCVAFEMREGV